RIVAGEKQESGVTGRCQGSALCVSKGGAPLPAVRSDIAKDTRLQPLRELLPDLFRSRPVRPASEIVPRGTRTRIRVRFCGRLTSLWTSHRGIRVVAAI